MNQTIEYRKLVDADIKRKMDALYQILRIKKVKQKDLAERLYISPGTVRYKFDNQTFSQEELYKIINMLWDCMTVEERTEVRRCLAPIPT